MVSPAYSTRRSLKWIAVDLDDTLAKGLWTPDNPTSEIGEPLWHNVRKLERAVLEGYSPVIHTARGWTDYERIEGWLNHFKIPWTRIVCGKILAALYVDDKARNAEAETWVP